jgi:hypothetical protein
VRLIGDFNALCSFGGSNFNHPCVLAQQQPQSLFSAWNDVVGWGFGVGIGRIEN